MKQLTILFIFLLSILASFAQVNSPVLTTGVSGGGSGGAQAVNGPYFQNNTQSSCNNELHITMEVQGTVTSVRLHISKDHGLGSYAFSTSNGLTNLVFNEAATLPTTGNGTVYPVAGVAVDYYHYSSPNFMTIKYKIDRAYFSGLERGDSYVYTARCNIPGLGASAYSTQKYFGMLLCAPSVNVSGNTQTVNSVTSTAYYPLNKYIVHYFTNYNSWSLYGGSSSPVSSQTYFASGTNNQNIPTSLTPGQTYWVTARWSNTMPMDGMWSQPIQVPIPLGCVTPTADFLIDDSGDPTIIFSDASSGTITSYNWDFGDGNSSTQASPSHTYSSNNTFNVSLTVSSTCGNDVAIQSVTIQGNQTPCTLQIDDIVIIDESCPSVSDGSLDIVVSGGSGSYTYSVNGNTQANGNFTGLTNGNYNVDITDDVTGCPVNQGGVVINTLGSLPQVAISIDNTNDPVTTFEEAGTGSTTWDWDFGDGTTGSQQIETHTYSQNGMFMITLTGTNDCGIDTKTDMVSISNSGGGNCNWTAAITSSLPTGGGTINIPDEELYMNFDSTIQDYSGNNNHGTQMGTHSFVPAKVGNGLKLRGVNSPAYMSNPDAVFVANSASLQFTTEMSVSYWIRIDGSNIQTSANCSGAIVNGIGGTVVAKDGDRNGMGFNVWDNSSDCYFTPWNGGQGANAANLSSVLNNWRHMVYTTSGNTIKIYVDGVLVQTATGNVDFTYPNQRNLYIGVAYNGAPYLLGGACLNYWGHIDGTIDELRIFSRAITAQEASDLYNFTGAATAVCPGTNLQLDATPTGTGYTYQWNTGDQTASISVSPTATTTYDVTISDANGCTSNATIDVDVLPSMNVGFSATVQGYDVQFNNASQNVSSVSWDLGDGNNSTSISPMHTYSQNGTYNVIMTATSPDGCDESYASSVVINVTNCIYEVGNISMPCTQATVCVPIDVNQVVTNGIIGLDFTLHYDPSAFTPTGNVNLGSVVSNGGAASYFINTATSGEINVSIYYLSSAGSSAAFVGTGNIACVEFMPLVGNGLGNFTIDNLVESFATHADPACGTDGSVNIISDDETLGKIFFHNDMNLLLTYDAQNPANYLITTIEGTDMNCLSLGTTAQTDLNGEFTHSTGNGDFLRVERDIPNTTLVMSAIGGNDAYHVGLITTNNVSFIPDVYQIMAADVNLDGFVTAGDITQILQRAVLNTGEFNQVGGLGKDWLFVDDYTVQNTPVYTISSIYPGNDNIGFSKWNVPQVTTCLPIQSQTTALGCSMVDDIDIHAILLGDVDANWSNIAPVMLKTTNTNALIYLDIAQANVLSNANTCEYQVPIFVDTLYKSLDFVMNYDSSLWDFVGVSYGAATNVNTVGFDANTFNGQILLSSFSKIANGITSSQAFFFLNFISTQNSMDSASFVIPNAYLNGQSKNIEVIGTKNCGASTDIVENEASLLKLFPNPGTDIVNVYLGNLAAHSIELFTITGQMLKTYDVSHSELFSFEISDLAVGTYLVKVNTDDRQYFQQLIKE